QINKEMAQKLLDRVDEEHQRPASEARIRRLLRDMDEGRWKPGVARVVINGKDQLIDGQKTLIAFLRSKLTTLEINYCFNPYPEAERGYDQVESRRLAQDLKWRGVESSSLVSPTVTVIYQYEKGYYRGTAYNAARSADQYPTGPEGIEFEKMHPGIAAHFRKTPPAFKGRGIPMAALFAASYILSQTFDHIQVEKFFTSLFEATDIPPKSPIWVLRDALERRKGQKRLRNGEAVAWVFKAWQCWINKLPLTRPIMREKEPFPELIPVLET